MAWRVLGSSFASSIYSKPQHLNNRFLFSSIFIPLYCKSLFHSTSSLSDVTCMVFNGQRRIGIQWVRQQIHRPQRVWIHSGGTLMATDKKVEPERNVENTVDGTATGKPKRKKLKRKRAVVRWLKFFRYQKKKDYERMTPDEKILYKLKKAKKKEERYTEALKKLEPSESSDTSHDPEILTPEEHFYFLKMGLKSRNYVPIGRRGIYKGVILNMHLHWKKHQTLQVIVKTFPADEVKEIATELARLSGGIVLAIHEEFTIIMYRGKNYVQPPTEIMSPRITLSRNKALEKSKYRDGLRSVRKYIPQLEQDMELLVALAKNKAENKTDTLIDEETQKTISSDTLREMLVSRNGETLDSDELTTDSNAESESEALSDIFESESDTEVEEREEQPLYLNEFEKFPVENDENVEDFDKNMHHLSSTVRKSESMANDTKMPDFDEVDRMFLRAASLLKKKRR